MKLTNSVVDQELDACISKHKNIKNSHKFLHKDNSPARQGTAKFGADKGYQPSYPISGRREETKAFEYKPKEEPKKTNPNKAALSGWDVSDKFDDSEDSEVEKGGLKIANASEDEDDDDWDISSNKKSTNRKTAQFTTQPKNSPMPTVSFI